MAFLPSVVSTNVRARCVVSADVSRYQLDQAQHWNGVEKVHPEYVRRPARGHRELHDRDGGRVGGQDRVSRGNNFVQRPEQLDFGGLIFEDCLHDHVPVGQLVQVLQHTDPVHYLLRRHDSALALSPVK